MLSVSMVVRSVKSQINSRVLIFFILMASLALLAIPANAEMASRLVISEVQIAGATAGTEFIEVYNPTDLPVDLSAMPLKLHIRNSTGSDGNKNLTFTNTTIPAYGFFLIAPAGSAFATQADATYPTSGNMLVSNGAAYISTSSISETSIIDKVGLGSQQVGGYENAAYPVNPAAGTSIERKAKQLSTESSMNEGGEDAFKGNSWDSNDNSSDFLGRSVPSPQNSTSAGEQPVWDAQGPVITINSPANAQIVNGLINIECLIDDILTGNSNVGEASYSVDGGESVAMSAADGLFDSPSENVVSQLDTKNLSNGIHTISITSMDSKNNFSTFNVEIIIENDLTPPTTAYSINPGEPNGLNGYYNTVPQVSLSSSETGVTYYRWDTSANYSVYSSPISAPQGNHDLFYYSIDLEGNSETPKSLNVKTDSQAPVAIITSPKDGTYLNSNSLNIRTGIIDVQSSISEVKLYVDDVLVATTSSLPGNFAFNIAGRKNGDRLKINVLAIDQAGNQSMSLPVTVYIDRTQPKITDLIMKNKVSSGGMFNIGYKITDMYSPTANVQIKILRLKTKRMVKNIVQNNVPTGQSLTASLIANLAPGNYKLYFHAIDKAGNKEARTRTKILQVKK